MVNLIQRENPSVPLHNENKAYNEIRGLIDPWDLPEGHHILHPGLVQDCLYLVSSGVLRMYTKGQGPEVTRWFFGKGDIAFSPLGFMYTHPSDVFIGAACRSLVTPISKSYYFDLCERYPSFKEAVNNLQANFLSKTAQCCDDLKVLSAYERYSRFMQEHPDINTLVQVKHLSSFLGMTPETLSRVRREHQMQNFTKSS